MTQTIFASSNLFTGVHQDEKFRKKNWINLVKRKIPCAFSFYAKTLFHHFSSSEPNQCRRKGELWLPDYRRIIKLSPYYVYSINVFLKVNNKERDSFSESFYAIEARDSFMLYWRLHYFRKLKLYSEFYLLKKRVYF